MCKDNKVLTSILKNRRKGGFGIGDSNGIT